MSRPRRPHANVVYGHVKYTTSWLAGVGFYSACSLVSPVRIRTA